MCEETIPYTGIHSGNKTKSHYLKSAIDAADVNQSSWWSKQWEIFALPHKWMQLVRK